MNLLDTTNARAAVGYIRVSTDQQAEHGNGLDIQRDAIAALAAAEGLELVAIHADEGISGSEDLTGRRGLADALADLHNGTARTLIVPKLDRLARDLIIQEQVLADAWRTGATVLSCSATERVYCQPDSPDDPSRTLIRQILGAVAAYERSMIRLRLVAGRRRRLAADGYAGGPEPYGWSDDSERAVLAHIAHMRRYRYTWQTIAAALNRMGAHKRNGGKWTPQEAQRTYSRAVERGVTIVPAPLNLDGRLPALM